jgi:PAS domain S-box-containing protein
MAPARQSIKPGVTLAGAAVEKSAPCYDPIGLASGPSTGSRSAPVLAVATSTMPTAQSETLRLAALDRYGVLDTPRDPEFDRITRLAAQFFDAPMAAISFVAHDRSWFKSTYGFAQSQLARPASLCSCTIGCSEALVIPDAAGDEKYARLALVAGHPRVRFYAGAPVVTSGGFAVGALAIMDTRPRGPLPELEICALRDFSALISRELNARASADAASQEAADPSILSTVVQNAQDAVVSVDLNGAILTWNPAAARLFGYSAAEVQGRPIDIIIPPDRFEEAGEITRKVLQGQPIERCETVRIRKDGARRFVSLSLSAIQDSDGRLIGTGGIAHDITPLKLAEAARREAEDRLKLAQEAAGLGIWDESVGADIATCSEQYFRMYGLPANRTTISHAEWLSCVHPEDRDGMQAYHDNLLGGTGQGEAEFRAVWPDGSVHWIVSRARMYSNAAGEAARVVGINLDVTQLREAERARRESEQRYSDLFRTMSQGVMYMDGEGVVLSANPATGRLFGLPIEETRGRRRSTFHLRATTEAGVPMPADEFPSMVALRTGREVHDVVLRVWNEETDEPHWISMDAIPRFRAGETKPYEVQIIHHDLTAQFEAAARLRASEERFRLLIEHGAEVIGVIGPAGAIKYVSPSVERVFDYPPDLLVGANALEYVHADDRQSVRESLANILHAPPSVAATFHVRMRHRDGGWRTVESTAANCLRIKGLRGIVVNLRDISERVRYEEQLRISHDQVRQLAARVESAREEERGRISREVHDEFGQMLSVLKLDLENLAVLHRPRKAEARDEFDTRVAAMVGAIELSVNTVRRIAAELRPAVFEHLGLVAALNWQLQEFESRTGIPCRRRGLRQDPGLAAEPALAVFRIFQEILTNVLLHAHATAVEVAAHSDRDWFILRVSDNGKGFDPKSLPPSHSLGLFGMRERAGMLGGTIEWSGRRNGGTTVTVRLPRGGAGAPPRNLKPASASDL